MSTPAPLTNPVSLNAGVTASSPTIAGTEASIPFSNLLQEAVGQVEALENQAHATVLDLVKGTGADVHQAVIAAQKADMALELVIAVRNKAVQAYQSVMGMQF
jgi:flagellar hook-basal body complex protein FliE